MVSAGQLIRERRGAITFIVLGAAFLAMVAACASIGGPAPPAFAATAVIDTLLHAGLAAALYILAGLGWGRLFAPLTRGAADPIPLQAGLGLGWMLSLSHALGSLGLLVGSSGLFWRLAAVLIGLVLLLNGALQAWRSPVRERVAISPVALLAMPGVALMVASACQPPGWLWASEFGGYDALSYHLQLPQEWLGIGRIAPLEHNVYSYQPGYIESAFLHVALLMEARPEPASGSGSRLWGLVAGDGMPLMACQFLHAGLAVVTAWVLARCVRAAGRTAGLNDTETRASGAFGGAIFLLTPWIVVVGSLAYNEMGVTALGAAALLAALQAGMPPARRGIAAGLLVGVACGCKATALLFIGLPVLAVLLGLAPRRDWWRIVLTGGVAGVVALSPWLVRNALAGGNPVFPYLTWLFGSAHWTAEQVERFRAATIFDGSIFDRVSLLFFEDAHDPAGPRHRGLLHLQWALFFPLCFASAAVVIAVRSTRWVGILLTAGPALQLLAWLFASHLQSRFLVPLAVPGCVLIGLAAAHARRWPRRADLVAMVAAAGVQFGVSLWVFSREKDGRPNAALVEGPGAFSGRIYADLAEAERVGTPSPQVVLNLSPEAPGTLYLVGDATPLYFGDPLVYSTTWDRSLLGEAIRAQPDNPAAWTAALRQAGVRRVLVAFGELARLRRSGFLDPALTPEAIELWLSESARPVREWPNLRRVLFELSGSETAP